MPTWKRLRRSRRRFTAKCETIDAISPKQHSATVFSFGDGQTLIAALGGYRDKILGSVRLGNSQRVIYLLFCAAPINVLAQWLTCKLLLGRRKFEPSRWESFLRGFLSLLRVEKTVKRILLLIKIILCTVLQVRAFIIAE
jgi:hypothetical protein